MTIGDINSYWALTLLAHDSTAEVDTRFQPKVTLAPGRVEVTAIGVVRADQEPSE